MKSEPVQIGGLIEETIKKLKIGSKLSGGAVFNDWEQIVGKKIADKARPHSLRGGCLVLKTESATWSQELSFMDEELIRKINDHAGECLVKKLRFKTK